MHGFNCLIMISTMCRLKSFCGTVSPKTIRYSRQLYANVMLMTFMTNGQYHFFPQITGLKSDNARSSTSTPPIPQLYATRTAGCWIFFSFSFYPSLCTSNGLHTIHITSSCNNRIVIPSYKSNVGITPEIKKTPFIFLHFFWHQPEVTLLSYHFSLC